MTAEDRSYHYSWQPGDIVVESPAVEKFDDDQERDAHGRWSGSGSPDERVRMALENTVGPRTPEGDAAVAQQEHAAIANEQAARGAGHLADVPHAALDRYASERQTAQGSVSAISDRIDAHREQAAQALADLHAHDSENELSATRDLVDHMNATSGHMADLAGGGAAKDFVRTSAHVQPGADATPAARAAFGVHAERTQSALEALHAEQVKAVGDLHAVERQHDRAARAARREAEVDPEDLINHDAVAGNAEHEQRAQAAAESLANYEYNRREELTGGLNTHFEDAHGALKDEIKQTAASIRELSKITGRVPKIAKPGKKS